jgi:hypothetical protein
MCITHICSHPVLGSRPRSRPHIENCLYHKARWELEISEVALRNPGLDLLTTEFELVIVMKEAKLKGLCKRCLVKAEERKVVEAVEVIDEEKVIGEEQKKEEEDVGNERCASGWSGELRAEAET